MNLFSGGSLNDWLHEQLGNARREIEETPAKRFATDVQAAVERVIELYEVEPIEIDWAAEEADDAREVKTRIREWGEMRTFTGHGIAVHIPYRGSMRVFSLRPSHWSNSGAEAEVRDNEIVIDVILAEANAPAFDSTYAHMKQSISDHIGWANADIATWRNTFRSTVQNVANARKAKLDAGVAMTASISVPMRRRSAAESIPIPAVRQSVRPSERQPTTPLSSPPAAASKEYVMEAELYEDVVRTLRAVGNSMERLPGTVTKFDEEELRDVLLFILSANYEGQAGGELFNGEGKTDILVRWQDRNAFIGECKFWKGEVAFAKAIDQLAGYVVWRDTKAALILFIRNKDATAAIETADATIRDHASFVSAAASAEPNLRRDYVIRSKDDADRHISLALLPIVLRDLSADD